MNLTDTYRNYLRLLSKRALIVPKLYRYSRAPIQLLERKRLSSPNLLNPREKGNLSQLRAEGYSPANELVDAGLLEELQASVVQLRTAAADAPRGSKKTYWSSLLPKELDTDHILVRFALQENILQLVAAYFKESPYLYNIDLLSSFGTDTGKWDQSQLWHQDTSDAKVLKLWVYVSDVDSADQGPFTYLPADYSRVLPNLFQRRVSDERMRELGFADKAVAVLGPRKTSFLIDTRHCYHLGSRVNGDNVRLAYVATYFSFTSLSPDNAVKNTARNLSPLQRLALSRR